jgi:hypothetical protein
LDPTRLVSDGLDSSSVIIAADGTKFSLDRLAASPDGTHLSSPAGTVIFHLDGELDGGTETVPPSVTPGKNGLVPNCQEQRGTRPTKYFAGFDITVAG